MVSKETLKANSALGRKALITERFPNPGTNTPSSSNFPFPQTLYTKISDTIGMQQPPLRWTGSQETGQNVGAKVL